MWLSVLLNYQNVLVVVVVLVPVELDESSLLSLAAKPMHAKAAMLPTPTATAVPLEILAAATPATGAALAAELPARNSAIVNAPKTLFILCVPSANEIEHGSSIEAAYE